MFHEKTRFAVCVSESFEAEGKEKKTVTTEVGSAFANKSRGGVNYIRVRLRRGISVHGELMLFEIRPSEKKDENQKPPG